MRDLDSNEVEPEVDIDIDRRFSPRHDREPRPVTDLTDPVPTAQLANDIAADQKKKLRLGTLTRDLGERIDRIRRARPPALALVNFEAVRPRRRRPDHPGADVGRRLHLRSLQRMLTRRDETHPIEAKSFRRIVSNDQVPDVRRVEAPAEDAESHRAPAARSRPRAPPLGAHRARLLGLQLSSLGRVRVLAQQARPRLLSLLDVADLLIGLVEHE